NVYLYQVTPNAAMRNGDLPLRNQRNEFVNRPCNALDLHYLFTCFGKEERLEPERLLGIAATVLHGFSTLSPAEITDAVSSVQGHVLAESDLAFQPESVKLWQHPLSLDDLHKLWSIFSPAPYRLSMVYQASVVLLDADVPRRRAVPARSARIFPAPA